MDILQLSKQRFSARKFTDERVSADDLQYILDVVRLAPSACNRQPWKFLIVESGRAKDVVCQSYNREWIKSAPIYIVCLRDKTQNWVREDGKQHGDIDVAIATEHLCLAAAERGLGTCWVCNFVADKLSELFDATVYEPIAIIPLGHIAPDCPRGKKIRKSIDEIVEHI